MGKWQDLKGQKFGEMTAISYLGSSKWLCKCSCGVEKVCNAQPLKDGRIKTCKTCKSRVKQGMMFGRLTTIEKIKKSGRYYWKCFCMCGNTCEVSQSSLASGNANSCGCLSNELSSARARTHGLSETRIYKIWKGIFDRCENQSSSAYHNYGARGISVCNEWQTFLPFYEWSMSHGYTDELTIDRIDVNGDYCPENCRWITREEQARNKRTNVLITYNGRTMIAAQWEKELGLSRELVSNRKRKGWSDVECIEGRKKKPTTSPNG